MISRILSPLKNSILLLGPRGVGKTTFVLSHYPAQQTFVVNLLDTDVFLRYSRHPQQFKADVLKKVHEGFKYCLVDEVQKLPVLLDVVHDLMHSDACTFILTGSSARKLKRGASNLLAGRALQYFLFPFVYSEISQPYDLENILRFGSLPAAYTAEAALKIKFLQTYVNTYLAEEVQAESLTRNLGGFSRFLEVAASQCGDILSYQNVGQACQVSAKTVQAYFQILEDTLLGFRLEPWRKSLKKRLVAHPRFYLFDTGVTNAINRRLSNPPDPQTRGRLFEQLMILESQRMLHYCGSEARLFFWRTEHGAEVDMLIEKHGEITAAIEFKSTSELGKQDFNGLHTFAQDQKNVPCYIVYCGLQSYQAGTVTVLTYQDFLRQLKEFLLG